MFYQKLYTILLFYIFGINANTNEDCKFVCIQRCQTSCLAKSTIPSLCLNTCPTACNSACSNYLYVNQAQIAYLRPPMTIQTTTKAPLLPILDTNLFQPIVKKYNEIKNYLYQSPPNIGSEGKNINEIMKTNHTLNVCRDECLNLCESQCDPDNDDISNVCETLCKPFCSIRCGLLSKQFDLFSQSTCSSICAPNCNTICVIKEGLKKLISASNVPTVKAKEYVNEISNHLNPNVHYVKEVTTIKPSELVKNIKICVNQCVNRCSREISDLKKPFENQISKCYSPCENVCKNKKNVVGKKTCDILKCSQNCMYQCYGLKNKKINCESVCERTCDSMCMAPEAHRVSSHFQMMLKVDTLYKLDIMKNDCLSSCTNYSPKMASSIESNAWIDVCHKSCTSLDYERKRIMNVCSIGCQGQCKENCLYSDKGYAQCDPICKASCDNECGKNASKYKECEPNCLSTCNKTCKNKMSDFKCSISCYALCRNEACSKR
uniref:ShKT domain-containing protein n=1 Tax=Strongyloides stercoralis TaxID=6248 RepID=A0A0K0EE87_STRER